ncbi:MAG: lysylphosphatidylglycerol synthase transmembrane domain-containing protein [Anaerolineae bacterium]
MSLTAEQKRSSGTEARLRSWSFWLGLFTSLGCVAWAIGALDWAAVAEDLGDVSYFWVGLSTLTVLLTIATRLARWAALLRPRQARPGSLMAAMLVGQLLNYFAPARAGDLARAYLLGYTEGQSKVWALGTVALEKLWDVWALLCLIGWLSFSRALPGEIVSAARGLALLSFLALAFSWLALVNRPRAVALVAWLGRYLPASLDSRLRLAAERLLDGLDGLRRPRVWLWAALWSAATWGLGALTNHTAFLALGLSLPLAASLALLVVLQMGIALPSLPGRVGVFEGLCIVVLAWFDVEREVALAVGLVLHAVVFVPPILLGLYYAWRIRKVEGEIERG